MSTKLKMSTKIIRAVLLQHLPIFQLQMLPAFNVYPNIYMPNNVQNGLLVDTNGCLQHQGPIPYSEINSYQHRYKTKHRHHKYSIDFADAYSDYDYRDIEPESNILPTNLMQQSQSSVVIVPYPYPLLLSEVVKTTTASTLQTQKAEETTIPTITSAATIETTTSEVTTMSTTTEPTTKSTSTSTSTTTTTTSSHSSPEESSGSKEEARRFLKPNTKSSLLHIEHLESMKDNSYRDIIAKVPDEGKKTKYILTSMRRTKLNWVPKYGIVPIPDQIAGKLMAQLQSYKDLQARRKNLRRMVALQHAKR